VATIITYFCTVCSEKNVTFNAYVTVKLITLNNNMAAADRKQRDMCNCIDL